MRKAIFILSLLVGTGAGYLSARHDDWGLQIGMMSMGALFGAAIGGGLSQIGKRPLQRRRLLTEEEIEPIPGSGMTGRDVSVNYPRDKGQPPFSRMPDAEPDKNMFNPDKVV